MGISWAQNSSVDVGSKVNKIMHRQSTPQMLDNFPGLAFSLFSLPSPSWPLHVSPFEDVFAPSHPCLPDSSSTAEEIWHSHSTFFPASYTNHLVRNDCVNQRSCFAGVLVFDFLTFSLSLSLKEKHPCLCL